MKGGGRKGLRYTHRKLAKLGVTFNIVFSPSLEENISTLKAVSDAWLKEKNTREKGFPLGCFNSGYLQHFPVGLVLYQEKVVAFANLWQSGGPEEISVDLMRHLPDAPSGVMVYLFIELMLWSADQGFSWFNLGMAPLSGMETREMALF